MPLRNRIPLTLIGLILLYLALATVYLNVVPPLEGFDAAAHMNAINYWREKRQLPPLDLATNQYSYELLTQPPLYYMTVAAVTSWVPANGAATDIRASANRYFPGLSTRQSIDLPDLPTSVAWAMFVARLCSMLGGLSTVVLTWLWVRSALPTERWLPLLVGAVVVCNPLFLFVNTAITNDAWAAAATTAVVYGVTRLASRPPKSLGPWLLLGAVAGLAALTKYSVLLVAIPALMILLQYRCHRPWSRFVGIAFALLGGALLTAGWWYGRNLWLYGQPIPLAQVSEVITTLERATLMTPAETWELLPFLFYSYWGLFVAIFAPERFFETIQWVVLIGLIGLPLGLYRRHQQRALPRVLWLALVWFGLNLVSMVNYMRLITYGEQARFLLTAAPAIALLLVFGWQSWVPTRLMPAFRGLLLPAALLFALWPLSTLQEAYAQPPTATVDDIARPVEARFRGGMTVAGYTLRTGGALPPGATLPVDLYFTTEQPIAKDYTFFLQLVDHEETLLYQFDGVPAAGRHPTRQWQPGQLFVDHYALTVEEPILTDTVATLLVGFYEYESPTDRIPLFDAANQPIGDRLILGEIRLLATPPVVQPPAAPPVAKWAGGIELLEATVRPAVSDTSTYVVDLQWRTTALLPTDYTLFVQFLNAAGEIVAQADQEPRNGLAPTSTWLRNERIGDEILIRQVPAWSQVILGFYNVQSGERLPLFEQVPPVDYIVLP